LSSHFCNIAKVIFAVVIGLQMLTMPSAVAQKPASPAKKKSNRGGSSASASSGEQMISGKKAPTSSKGKDEMIVQIIHEVSPQQVQQTIEKLASFGTRNTLSVNNPDAATSGKGIVAARNWIKSEFERYSAACGGCLEVKTDESIAQPGGPNSRYAQPTEVQNIYAILRGTDSSLKNRI
jgi:hypothetical protein